MRALASLLLHRRVVGVQLWLCGLVVCALPVLRWSTSSRDLDSALRAAQAQVDVMQPVIGEEFDLAAAFVEPRYLAAAELPFDLAALTVGLALVCLLAGAVLCGGDWRTRSVHVTWPSERRRGESAVRAVVVWTGWCAVVAVVVLVVAAVSLLGVAYLRGSADGVALTGVLLVVVRGVLVVAGAASIGAAAGVVARSEVVVILGVLVYVVLGELVAPAVWAADGFRSGVTRLVGLVVSEAEGSRGMALECLAPRCPDLVAPGGGSAAAYVAGAGAVVLVIVLAGAAARRPVWR